MSERMTDEEFDSLPDRDALAFYMTLFAEARRARASESALLADNNSLSQRFMRQALERDELLADNRRLREALRIQDPRNATECYERIAAEFQAKTGLWPPGKSRPMEMGADPRDREEVYEAWRAFCNKWHEDFFDAALSGAKPGGEG